MKVYACQPKTQLWLLGLLVYLGLATYTVIYKYEDISILWSLRLVGVPGPTAAPLTFPTDEELMADVLKRHPMFPVAYLRDPHLIRRFNRTCAKFPEVLDVRINNLLWQHVHLQTDRDIYLYSAHLDNRETVLTLRNSTGAPRTPVVRLLGMTNHNHSLPLRVRCQFWFEDALAPVFSEPATYEYLWNFGWGSPGKAMTVGLLLACPLPDSAQVPDMVSLVEDECDNPTNVLEVQRAPNPIPVAPRKGSIAVCVKSMNYWYEDRSYQLVEWLELVRLLGAEKVYIYELIVHPNMKKVLEHYEGTGFVDLRPYTLPGSQVDGPGLLTLFQQRRMSQKRWSELIPYNDCLYRNWYRYEYLAVIDTDEIILPAKPEVYTWDAILAEKVQNATQYSSSTRPAAESQFSYSSICGRNVHFVNNDTDFAGYGLPEDVPPYLYMLSHVSRSPTFEKPGFGVKCFHATSRVLTLHNHFALKCLGGCRATHMDIDSAHMAHYRSTCSISPYSKCPVNAVNNETVVDTTIWKYKKPLIEKCNRVMKSLDMIA